LVRGRLGREREKLADADPFDAKRWRVHGDALAPSGSTGENVTGSMVDVIA
jgi:hypothetical protein